MPNGEHLSTGRASSRTGRSASISRCRWAFARGAPRCRQKLLIARDQANVEQRVHAAVHELASTIRDLDGAYEQYLAFKETREAADVNVRVQTEKFRAGQDDLFERLQALNDWGNAVTRRPSSS